MPFAEFAGFDGSAGLAAHGKQASPRIHSGSAGLAGRDGWLHQNHQN